MDLESVRIYVRVAELGSFTQAAQQLNCPKATVSRAVLALETRLGVKLLERSTRSVALTPQGRRFLDRCHDLLAEADELGRLFTPGSDDAAPLQGRLRVDLPAGLAAALVLPQLPDFQRRHPGLRIALDRTDARLESAAADAPDCLLRLSDAPPPPGLAARALGALPRMSCASPTYLDALGWPQTPQDLQGHRLVVLDPSPGEATQAAFTWLDPADGRPRSLPLASTLAVSSAEDALAACAAGLGIVQAPQALLRPAVEAGRLVEILADWRVPPLPVALLHAQRREVPRRVRVFMEWLEGVMRPHLAAAPSPATPARGLQPAAPAPAASGTANAR